MSYRLVPVAVALALVFAACSTTDAETEMLRERVAELEAAQVSTTTAAETTVSTLTATTAPADSTTTSSASSPEPIEKNAETILEGLAAQGAPITGHVAYTAATDPNELLGRPGGYNSKANFADERVEARGTEPFEVTGGGSIEVYDTSSGATERARYIRDLLDSVGLLGNEYHIRRGTVLVRLSEGLVPEDVVEYEQWLDDALADLEAGIRPPPFEAVEAHAPVDDVEARSPDSSVFVAGTFDGVLSDGEATSVSVIEQGTEIGSSVPVIVRNMTSDSIIRVEVAGIARDIDGSLIASGSSQGLKPNLIAPGEIAFGYVYFGYESTLDSSSVIEYSVGYESSTGSAAQYENIRDLTPFEWTHSGRNIVVLLSNDSDEALSGPFSVYVACFAPDGTLTDVTQGFADNDSAGAGSAVSAQIRAADVCNSFLVAGSGFTG